MGTLGIVSDVAGLELHCNDHTQAAVRNYIKKLYLLVFIYYNTYKKIILIYYYYYCYYYYQVSTAANCEEPE